VELDELPAQRQPKARPFRLPVRGADLTELLEHRVVVFGGDADARVRHRDLCRPVCEARAHGDPAALRRELRFRIGFHLGDVIEKADGTVASARSRTASGRLGDVAWTLTEATGSG
jgi:hypothetical protein